MYCNYSAESGVGRDFSPLGVKISVFPYARCARLAKLAYAQTVAMLMREQLPQPKQGFSARTQGQSDGRTQGQSDGRTPRAIRWAHPKGTSVGRK